MNHKFPYRWTLKDAVFTKDKGKVFSCFSCGGGSTMGYKLAGFDVIGCNEIDPKMMAAYVANHNPKYSYLEPIQTFKDRQDLPDELFNLDILDGSPPCSSFSMAGTREKDWGNEKKFKEGQKKQILDTLFFDFIDLAKRLQPKIVIAENVKGLTQGNAKSYVAKICERFASAGYSVHYKLLDASRMGVPQKRERVFFFAIRSDLCDLFTEKLDMFSRSPMLRLDFNCSEIPFSEIMDPLAERDTLTEYYVDLMRNLRDGEPDLRYATERLHGKQTNFGNKIQYPHRTCYSILAADKDIVLGQNRYKTGSELVLASTFPMDYNFGGIDVKYLVGMSVPPVMVAQIASRIWGQWLSKIGSGGEIFEASKQPIQGSLF